MIQTIIVTVIFTLAVVYTGIKIYKTVTGKNDPCKGCQGCEIRRQLLEKRQECMKNKPSCCKK